MILRIDRIVNRDGVSVEEAKKHLRMREESNLGKWSAMYTVDQKDFGILSIMTSL